ncbi:MAG: OmpA family protein [Planctomycetota bacterium]
MPSRRALRTCLVLGSLVLWSGCLFVPKSQLTAFESQNVSLVERDRAQAVRIENLETHSRNVEDQLMRAEEDLALLAEKSGLDREQLGNYEAERDQLHAQFTGLLQGRSTLAPGVRRWLAEISERYPSLQFDPQYGASKLDTDILFDVGQAELKPGADEVLRDLTRLLESPEGRDLKILVVGHTDDRLIAGKPVREKYPNNFHLSAHRALAVCDELTRLGLEPERLGVAGFGLHQPIAPNVTDGDRRKNRRVELFVMAPGVPLIGWTETTPGLY